MHDPISTVACPRCGLPTPMLYSDGGSAQYCWTCLMNVLPYSHKEKTMEEPTETTSSTFYYTHKDFGKITVMTTSESGRLEFVVECKADMLFLLRCIEDVKKRFPEVFSSPCV